MKYSVYDLKNKVVGEVDLNPNVFDLPTRVDLLSRVIEWQLAKRRSGNHKTKEVGDIRGSTKKIVRQKGSGGARHGSKRAPQFRGGAVIFGPVVRDHGYSLPKKVRSLGLRTALSTKAKENNLIIVDKISFKETKTKNVTEFMEKFDLSTALIVDVKENENLKLSVANINSIDVILPIGVNVYDIMRKEKLIITKVALEELERRFQ